MVKLCCFPFILQVKYACVHGGKYKDSKKTGDRPNTRTLRMECPMEIVVKYEGGCYVVSKLSMDHNHAVTETEYLSAPRIRALDRQEIEEVRLPK